MARAATSELSDPELQATAWDLEPLVEGEGKDGVESRLAEALTRAQAFSRRHAGKLAELDGSGLREAMSELEWAALSEERAEELLASDGLDFCSHHLRNVRRYREHLLSEAEEKILAEKSLTGAGAWTRLFEELTAAIEVQLGADEGGTVALDVALSRLSLADREARRTISEAVTAALAPA